MIESEQIANAFIMIGIIHILFAIGFFIGSMYMLREPKSDYKGNWEIKHKDYLGNEW